MIDAELQAVHFQLTRSCNLRCRMCGQWGIHGYQREHITEKELGRADWERIIGELTPPMNITLWGGEPLLAPYCIDIARLLKRRGFSVSMVTNGVLLKKYAAEMKDLFTTLFVSVDGSAPIHDMVRGVAGTFARVDEGIRAVREMLPGQNICIKTTLVRENLNDLAALAPHIRAWKADNWSLDAQMFLSEERKVRYEKFERSLGVADPASISWKDEFAPGYGVLVSDTVRKLIAANGDLPIQLGGHAMTAEDIVDWFDSPDKDIVDHHCYAPWRRLSIQSNGNTSFCLDITDGSIGNVREQSIGDIFRSEKADRFRAAVMNGENPACIRCVWKRHTIRYR